MSKKKEQEVSVKNMELTVIAPVLGLLSMESLSVDNMMNYIKLRKSIEDAVSTLAEVQKQIIKDYDIKTQNGQLVYQGHEKAEEIAKKLTDLNEKEFALSPAGFMTPEEFKDSAEKLNGDQVYILSKLLM
jgi:hypothetical protein